MKNRTEIDLLDRLLGVSQVKEKGERNLELLKLPASAAHWFFTVKEAFNTALDIRQTERVIPGKKGVTEKLWTQGTNFAFGQGDLLHTVGEKVAIQIEKATPVIAGTGAEPRHPGLVTFKIFSRLHSGQYLSQGTAPISQDSFVRLLITGACEGFSFHDRPYLDWWQNNRWNGA
jgi:hypothetical protein